MEMFYARMGLTHPIRSSKGESDHGTHKEGLKREGLKGVGEGTIRG